jgi:hypothetical protein
MGAAIAELNQLIEDIAQASRERYVRLAADVCRRYARPLPFDRQRAWNAAIADIEELEKTIPVLICRTCLTSRIFKDGTCSKCGRQVDLRPLEIDAGSPSLKHRTMDLE